MQDQVRISDKARHIPGGWNFIRGIFTAISRQPTMTDRPGIPLITKLLQSGKFSFFQCLENHYICSNGHRNVKNESGSVQSITWTLIVIMQDIFKALLLSEFCTCSELVSSLKWLKEQLPPVKYLLLPKWFIMNNITLKTNYKLILIQLFTLNEHICWQKEKVHKTVQCLKHLPISH